MESNLDQHNKILSGYFYFSILLVFYVFWRSLNISFTHDESLSYTLITGNETQLFTANNHWLNTILMYVSSRIFGYSELALRLPNVLALIVYLVFIYKIFRKFCRNIWPLIIALPLLLLNSFILDFFGLARGYGLGIAFFTASLYYFLVYFQKQQSVKYLSLLVICNLCCIYSNYAFLIAVLALHCAALVFFEIHRKKILQLVLFYVIEAILLIPAILNILYLSEKNELYAGGENNVFSDTLKSIISFSFESDHFNGTFIAAILLTLSVICSLFFFKSRVLNFVKLLILLLLVIPELLHFFLDMGYPKDRAAQYWMVIFGFFILFTAESILKKIQQRKLLVFPIVLFSALGILQIVNFISNFNLTHTIIWKYDADVKSAIQLIEKSADKNRQYSLGINWTLEPSVNYYRETRKLNWLLPVTREGVAGKHDFYLLYAFDFPALDSGKMKTIVYYPGSEMFVMRNF